jgi:hypothetical protein
MQRAFLAAWVVVCGCSSGTHDPSTDPAHGDLNPGDRKILGEPAPYDADTTLRDRQAELDASSDARRAVAWATVAKVLAPVALADHPTDTTPTVPRWQTWYAKDDFVRMYKKLYLDLGTDGRKARAPFTDAALTAIWPWNAGMVDTLPTWPQDRYAKYLARLKDQTDFNGEGAGNRVSYAPGTVDHFFRNYGAVLKCLPLLPTLTPDAAPPSDDNFTECFDTEFPLDAVVIKAQWMRAEFGAKVPIYDTSDAAIAALRDPSSTGDWGAGTGQADPTPDQIHTVRLSNGNVFRLVGLHIMTKELRKWLWITLWWSPDPDTDFGADRPLSLGGVWRNYKMCVATAHDHWCSNPYLEKGAGNARTNCIGCHQQAGSTLKPEDILAMPDNGRGEARANFPTDYLWAFDHTDNLSRVIADETAYYDSIEK